MKEKATALREKKEQSKDMLNKSDYKYQYLQSCERLPMDALKVAESVLFESRKESKSTRGMPTG
jgi:hypothetical protein